MRQLIVELEGQKAGARDRYSDFDAVFDSAYIPQSVAEIILRGKRRRGGVLPRQEPDQGPRNRFTVAGNGCPRNWLYRGQAFGPIGKTQIVRARPHQTSKGAARQQRACPT